MAGRSKKPTPPGEVAPPVAAPSRDLALGLRPTHSGSRSVIAYDPDRALEVCELIAQGHTLKAITEQKDEDGAHTFVSYSTFQRWVLNAPELRKAYLAARELSAFSFEDEALRLAKMLANGEVSEAAKVRAFDVAMNQLRWSASKRNPREYGERTTHNITVPIQINTSLDLGQGGVPASVEENVYKVTGVVKAGTVDLLTPSGEGVVPKKPVGRPFGWKPSDQNPDMPGSLEIKARRAEQRRVAEIEEIRREDALEVR